MPKLLDVYQYIQPKDIKILGLIRDATNPMSEKAKHRITLLVEALQNRDPNTTTVGFTDVNGTHIKIDPHPSDTTSTSSTLTPPPTAVPNPSTSRSSSAGYVVILQELWNKLMKRLSTMEIKVWFMV